MEEKKMHCKAFKTNNEAKNKQRPIFVTGTISNHCPTLVAAGIKAHNDVYCCRASIRLAESPTWSLSKPVRSGILYAFQTNHDAHHDDDSIVRHCYELARAGPLSARVS
jgi:hypothetical protein